MAIKFLNTVAVDTDVLYADAANNRVGIGTTSPGAKLDVSGAGNFSGGTVVSGIDSQTDVGISIAKGSYVKSNDGNYLRTLIGQQSGGSIDIGQGGTSLISNINLKPGSSGNIDFFGSGSIDMRVASSGNVGIGNTSPDFRLHTNLNLSGSPLAYLNGISNTFDATANLGVTHNSTAVGTGTGAGVYLANNANNDGAPSPIIAFSALSANGSYNHTYAAIYGIKTAGGADTNWVKGDLTFATGNTTGPERRMTILANGNVGIGVDDPQAKLEVKGTSASPADGNEVISVTNTTGGSKLLLGVAENSYGWIQSAEGSTYRNLLLNPLGGNVGIGTTSPIAKLDVVGTINASQGYSTSNTSRKYFWRTDNTGNSGAIWKKIGTYNSDGQSSRIMITATGTTSYSAGTKSGKMTIIAQVNNNNLLEGSFWQEGMAAQYGSVGFVSNSAGSHDIYYQVGSYAEYAYEAIVSDGTFTADSSTVSTPSFTHQPERSWNVNSNLLVNSSGNVGIGTTSPIYKLHVSGGDIGLNDGYKVKFDVSGTVTASEELVLDAGDTDSKIILDGADSAMRFITGNSTAIAINDSQNVGIGTTSPSQKLHVAGNMRLQNQLYDSTNSLGSNNQVLTKVSAGTQWKDAPVNAQMPDNTAPASAANVGTIRYRSTSNTSFVDVSMQTGATTYTWVNIVSNFW